MDTNIPDTVGDKFIHKNENSTVKAEPPMEVPPKLTAESTQQERPKTTAAKAMAQSLQQENTHSRIFGDICQVDSPRKNVQDTKLNQLNNFTRVVSNKKIDGNPLTGEGYDKQEIIQRRIPPGGFSSGLW